MRSSLDFMAGCTLRAGNGDDLQVEIQKLKGRKRISLLFHIQFSVSIQKKKKLN